MAVNLRCSTNKSEKLNIDGLFLSKAYNISARQSSEGLCVVMTLKGDAKFKGKMTCGLKNDARNIWLNFIRAVENQKICTLIGSFCLKYIKIQMKKYKRVMFYGTEEKLALGSKKDMRNLVNFDPTTQKPKNFTSMSCFCPKYMSFKLKNYRRVIFHDTEQWCKICINPDHVVWKMTWELGELLLEHWKSEKFFIDGQFPSKAYVSARTFQSIYVMTLEGDAKFKGKLKKNRFWFQKWQEFGKFWSEHLKF